MQIFFFNFKDYQKSIFSAHRLPMFHLSMRWWGSGIHIVLHGHLVLQIYYNFFFGQRGPTLFLKKDITLQFPGLFCLGIWTPIEEKGKEIHFIYLEFLTSNYAVCCKLISKQKSKIFMIGPLLKYNHYVNKKNSIVVGDIFHYKNHLTSTV